MRFVIKARDERIVGTYQTGDGADTIAITDPQLRRQLQTVRRQSGGVPIGPEGPSRWEPWAVLEYLRHSGYETERDDGQPNPGQDVSADRDGETLSGNRTTAHAGAQGRMAPAQGGVQRDATARRGNGHPVRPTR